MLCSTVRPADVLEEHNATSAFKVKDYAKQESRNKKMEVVHSLETMVELTELLSVQPRFCTLCSHWCGRSIFVCKSNVTDIITHILITYDI
jgi:hypothetical protein